VDFFHMESLTESFSRTPGPWMVVATCFQTDNSVSIFFIFDAISAFSVAVLSARSKDAS
jgi:hypothetical protein